MLNYPERQINNLKFSLREIDIISCVLNMRGAKKIANILQISHRTVERHIQNIMLKIGCNSQEGITDFVEKSSQFLQLKKHYTLLLINSFFQSQLIRISSHIKRQKLSYNLHVDKNLKQETKLFEKHMSLLGIELCAANATFEIRLSQGNSSSANKDGLYNICLENYYSDFFQMLVRLFPKIDFTAAISEFKHLEENTEEIKNEIQQRIITNLQNEVELAAPSDVMNDTRSVSPNFFFYKLSSMVATMLLFGVVLTYYIYANQPPAAAIISSSLSVPHSSNALIRDSVSKKISKIIKKSKEHITTIVLAGVGGAGKSTIAKQFAREHDAEIIWEINASSEDSLLGSYEELMQEICINEDCQQEFLSIQSQKETGKKLKRYMSSIARHFAVAKNWLLIFDNFETDSALAEYIPNNHKIWGNGVVIITTRDADIANNNYINNDNIIEVHNLNNNEKYELLSKLLNKKIEDPDKLKRFLEHIPPYPLDIMLASNYINKHEANFEEYLENIVNNTGSSSQEGSTLQDIGRYSGTRYAIVATSIEKIIEQYPEYKEYLLHTGLIDSNLITINYHGYVVKDMGLIKGFINSMMSNSLLQIQDEKIADDVYMIHRATQRIILDYMLANLSDDELNDYIQRITKEFSLFIEGAIQNDNIGTIKSIISHAEAMHYNISKHFPSYASITASSLANCYFYVGHNMRAAELLEQYSDKFDLSTSEGRYSTVDSKVNLGNIYSNIGQYDKAATVFNEAISLILSDTNNPSLLAWAKVNLARLYIKLGKYEDAEYLLSDAFEVYKDVFGIDNPETAWVMSFYGNLLIDIGEFEKAERLLLASHNIIQKHHGESHIKTATCLNDLSHLYIFTGNYSKAEQLLTKSKKIHDSFFDKQSPNNSWLIFNLGLLHGRMGEVQQAIEYLNQSYANHLEYHANDYVTKRDLVELASLYADVGNYGKAKALLDKSVDEYKNQFGGSHNKVAELYNKYARVHLGSDEPEKALDFIRKSLAIFKKNNHPQIYISYENLADYYLKNYNNQGAIRYLEKAEKILRTHYPIDSEITKNIIAKKNKILQLI